MEDINKLIDDITDEDKDNNKVNTTDNSVDEEHEDDDSTIDDLFEENTIENDDNSNGFFDDEDDERNNGIINEFVEDDDISLDDFDIDKYLKENYSFKEIEAIPFEEYKEQQLQNKTILSISKIYEQGHTLKDLKTFDDFLIFKKSNAHIFLITAGLPFEYEMFGMEPKFFICRAFSSKDYSEMIAQNPNAESDLDYYNDYIISSCVLYPEIRIEDVEKLEYGLSDILLSAIIKHSRFNTNYKIERL